MGRSSHRHEFVEIGGAPLVAHDPDQRRRGTPGDVVLYLEGPTGRKFLCVCQAAPNLWSKVELSA